MNFPNELCVSWWVYFRYKYETLKSLAQEIYSCYCYPTYYESKYNINIGYYICRWFDCSRRKLKPKFAKKRKAEGYISSGTVTGYYVSFLKMTLGEMDKYPHVKGHYIVVSNVPIHAYENIKKYI